MASILAVDDEPANLDLLEAILSPLGHAVRTASGALPALQAVVDERPDLILLDLMMPGMSGFEVCERLRRQEQTAAIPVILVTAAGLLTPEEQEVVRRAADLITKPILAAEVTRRVEETLRAAALQRELDRILEELFALESRRLAHRRRALASLLSVTGISGAPRVPAASVLLISADESVREHYGPLCAEHGLALLMAADLREAVERAAGSVGAAVLDLELPGGAALPMLEALGAELPGLPVVALARTPHAPLAREALRRGASGCVLRGLPSEWALAAIRRSLTPARLVPLQPVPDGGSPL